MSFLKNFPPYDSSPSGPREVYLREAIEKGRIDAPAFSTLPSGLRVTSRYLSIEGSTVPMSAHNALLATRAVGAEMPTAAEVDQIEAAPGCVKVPMPTFPTSGLDQLQGWRFEEAEQVTRSLLLAHGVGPATLTHGWRKDVLGLQSGRVAIYGGIRGAKNGGGHWQPVVNTSHEATYADYSHGVTGVIRPKRPRLDPLVIAMGYVGKGESPPLSNTGPFVRLCLAGAIRNGKPVGLIAGNWCAAFVGLVDHEAGIDRPWRCAVHEIVADARAAGTWRDIADDYAPKPSDLVVYRRDGQDPRKGGLGHVGYVALYTPSEMASVEGNKGDRVAIVDTVLPSAAVVGWVVTPCGA